MAKAVKNRVGSGVKKVTDSMVITFDGIEAPLVQCRKINNMFYRVGDNKIKDSGQCYLIGDTYYRVNTGKIAWDYTKGEYNLIELMAKGLVDKGVIGYFTPDVAEAMYYYSNDAEYVINEQVAIKNRLSYSFARGAWVESGSEPCFDRAYPNRPQYRDFEHKIYGMSGHPQYDKVAAVYSTQPKSASHLDQYLYDYIVGLEIETDGGHLPSNLYFKHGALPLYDGSINGSEVTTLPFKGPGTIDNLTNLFKHLSKYTSVTQNNSLHVNVGNLKDSPEFRVALYVLYYRLQQEINAFIPHYKKELDYLTKKKGGAKDHCKDLPSLDIAYRYSTDNEVFTRQIAASDKQILSFLHEGKPVNSTGTHFREGQPKWDWHSRYYSLNLMPLYFGSKETKRVEYRVHSGTVNPHKGIIWTLICTAITKFVEDNSDRILRGRDKILLEDVINESFEYKIAHLINEYIVSRAKENSTSIIKHEGMNDVYNKEFSRDFGFKFLARSEDGVMYDIFLEE